MHLVLQAVQKPLHQLCILCCNLNVSALSLVGPFHSVMCLQVLCRPGPLLLHCQHELTDSCTQHLLQYGMQDVFRCEACCADIWSALQPGNVVSGCPEWYTLVPRVSCQESDWICRAHYQCRTYTSAFDFSRQLQHACHN